jgi:hypothetical protein
MTSFRIICKMNWGIAFDRNPSLTSANFQLILVPLFAQTRKTHIKLGQRANNSHIFKLDGVHKMRLKNDPILKHSPVARRKNSRAPSHSLLEAIMVINPRVARALFQKPKAISPTKQKPFRVMDVRAARFHV